MRKERSNKNYIIALLGIILIGIALFFAYDSVWKPHKYQRKPQKVTMTIFVHGTFGPMLGLLSFPNVITDNLKGTLYRKINKKMRNDPYFYQDQAILTRGLHPIKPTFTPDYHKNKKIAAFPIIKAYQTVQEIVEPNNGIYLFYTFGWSGLISQSKRRIDALRFYNCLIEKVNQVKNRYKTEPIIKILAHSHGGNLCLNLIGINKLLDNQGNLKPYTHHPNEDKFEALSKLYQLIKNMPCKEAARKKNGSKDFDFQPTEKLPFIEELVLYGTPIQPETESFFTSPTWKNIYHFYSQQDFVQQLDWVSTKNFYSSQRLNSYILEKNKERHNIYQCRIMYEHDQKKEYKNKKTVESNSFWSNFFSKNIFFSQKRKDPTHKEMWFIMWRDEKKEDTPFLWPLPTVVFTPLFTKLIKEKDALYDIDINLTHDNRQVNIELSQHDSVSLANHATLTPGIVKDLKRKVKLWRPDTFTEESSFNAVYKHLIRNHSLR